MVASVVKAPRCLAIAFAIHWKVLLLAFILSCFGSFRASAYRVAILFQLLYVVYSGSLISVYCSFGNPFSRRQVFLASMCQN